MSLHRRDWLKGQLRSPARVVGLPFASPEFAQRCAGCGDCVLACPNGVIEIVDGKAALTFKNQGCDFCGDCGEACLTGAMQSRRAPWPYRAEIAGHCLALKGVLCGLCSEACEPRAIAMQPVAGGRRLPILNSDICSGCGECISRCPQAAIRITQIEEPVQ